MQAARGTPVDDRDDGPDGPGTAGSRPLLAAPRAWALFLSVAVLVVVVDQVAKVLAVRHLTGEPDVEVVGEILQLHLTYNPGAAFSLGTRFTVVLSCLAITATLVVLWVSRRVVSPLWAVALGLLLAGIDGNLIDRLFRAPSPFRGHVVDFLMLPNWPIFNVADMSINVGVALILLQVFRGVGLDGQRVEKPQKGAKPEKEQQS
ncbi:signal peptidase II [Pimelobacter simplex]|uniref:Lipoprotein signal peptidase n=1 Tax=Nocardioides simplex TaxID=2045 RepID=A0A0C5WYH6_NOCSI|nr:signal peptidase II [Pimelobacter simplex]AJR18358.1 Lipoprotein signal peptidase [Pimelobacter simplex]MCG8151598.1 signal peptidase II [Pimelobacter simplex]SFM47921.1 signal peptidase II [Pimelobacter simplex]